MPYKNIRKLLFLISVVISCSAIPSKNYLRLRENLIEEESEFAFGGNLILNENESLANECLMSAKLKEVDAAFETPSKFLPAKSFFEAKKEIEESEVFKIIRKMPKGGDFHAHSSAMLSLDFIVRNITYEPNLYICFEKDIMQFRFFAASDTDCEWELLSDLRKTNESIDTKIEEEFKSLETKDGNSWDKFRATFSTLYGLLKYRSLFEKYLYNAMQELYDDNVMFLEMRTSLSLLEDTDGTLYDSIETVKIYEEVSNRFMREHPDFLGAKIIYSPSRKITIEKLNDSVKRFKQLRAAFPDFIIGFDLVGEEDRGSPLVDFAEQLEELGKDTTFFFHAGETNWFGHSTDYNLYDAILLNTKRIGHGFALLKHPKLLDIVKERQIAVEVNPISNQVLGYVQDMRNHPAANFFAENIPVVISNDDPSFWGAKGLSYDFYEAFVGIMSREADLRALKQLAINSIVYSSFAEDDKKRAFNVFKRSWENFVDDLAQC